MKKILISLLVLLAINITFIIFFVITDIPKYTTVLILFLPAIIDFIISEKLFCKTTNKHKCYVYLILALASFCVSILFCLYEYNFRFLGIVGVFMVFIYTIVFNVIPSLIISLIYLIKYRCDEKRMIMEMVYLNVLYEDDIDDVDIICVPDHIATRINSLSQEFLDWLPNAINDIYWTIIDGCKCSVCETDGFVKWLNDNYCENSQMVTIVKKHVQYVNEYNAIEF